MNIVGSTSKKNRTLEEFVTYYNECGLNCIPLACDGSKKPLLKTWSTTEPYPWFPDNKWEHGLGCGIGIVCGTTSRNLCVFDFESKEIYKEFCVTIPRTLFALLFEQAPLVATGGGGVHIYVLLETPEPHLGLAWDENGDVLLETRSQGNYVVAWGSPNDTHESGKSYSLVHGDFAKIPLLSRADYETCVRVARSLNRYTRPEAPRVKHEPRVQEGERPGDWYNATADWHELLEGAGWNNVRGNYWQKPGGHGPEHHATLGYGDSDLFYVFSTSAHPFEAEHSYDKFAAYTLLNHNGDFSAAAAELGTLMPREPRPTNPEISELVEATVARVRGEAVKAPQAPAVNAAASALYKFAPLSSAAFDKQAYKLAWLVKRLLVKGQPAIFGGPKKSMKTNLLTDLAVSLGSGLPYLGFETNKTRTCFISGESGEATIQETARRICAAKGTKLSELDVWWDFRLPRLSVEVELQELARGLQREAIEVVIIDPLYLCLLSGGDKNASNMFDTRYVHTVRGGRVNLVHTFAAGAGDILLQRMVIGNLPEPVMWAVPDNLFELAQNHWNVTEVVSSRTLSLRKAQKQFTKVFNFCSKYTTQLELRYPFSGRADIWATLAGVKLADLSLHLRVEKWAELSNVIVVAPFARRVTRCMPSEWALSLCEFVASTGNDILPLHDNDVPSVPTVKADSWQHYLNIIASCKAVVTVDTAALHAAGGFGKPTLAFLYGEANDSVAKYYRTVETHYRPDLAEILDAVEVWEARVSGR